MSRSKPSVPSVIEDRLSLKDHGGYVKRYDRGDLLGQGGFAHCYSVKSRDSGSIYACKVVAKKKLRTKEYRNKMWSEIEIHRQLEHDHIVRFLKFFEDSLNVYVMIELCTYQSCMALMRRRKFLRESETRLLMHEICEAVSYLHEHCIIHRDLKIGNLLLTDRLKYNSSLSSSSASSSSGPSSSSSSSEPCGLHVKICDFGLAAKLSDKDEHRVTICGTPNYIAPEMLLDSKMAKSLKKLITEDDAVEDRHRKGHSFGVDIWSLGVIMFTFLTGDPPFQTKKVHTTYERITTLTYSFPKPPKGCDDSKRRQSRYHVSEHAKRTIESILQFKAEQRPRIDELCRQPFFTDEECPCPEWLPVNSTKRVPTESELFPLGRDHRRYRLKYPPMRNSKKSDTTEQSPLMKQDGFKTMSQELEIIEGAKKKKALRSRFHGSGVDNNDDSNHPPPSYSSSSTTAKNDRALQAAAMHSRALRPPSASMNKFGIRTERRGGAIGISIGGVSGSSAAEVKSKKQYNAGRISRSIIPENATMIVDTPFTRLMRHTRVCKIMETSKYGMGYQLSDGRIGLIFNDATKMVYVKPHHSYHDLCVKSTSTIGMSSSSSSSSHRSSKGSNQIRYYVGDSRKHFVDFDTGQPLTSSMDRDVAKKLKLSSHFANHIIKNHHCRLGGKGGGSGHSHSNDEQKFTHLCPDLLVAFGEYNTLNEKNHRKQLGSFQESNAIALCRCCHCKNHERLHNQQARHGLCLCPDWRSLSDLSTDLIFVTHWIQNDRAILLRLSNMATQIVFKEDNTALFIVSGRTIEEDSWIAEKRERDRRRRVRDFDGDSEMEPKLRDGQRPCSQLFYRNKHGNIEQFNLKDIRLAARQSHSTRGSSSSSSAVSTSALASIIKRFEYAQKLSRQMNESERAVSSSGAVTSEEVPRSSVDHSNNSHTHHHHHSAHSTTASVMSGSGKSADDPIDVTESRMSSKSKSSTNTVNDGSSAMDKKRRHQWMEVDEEQKGGEEDCAKRRGSVLKSRSVNVERDSIEEQSSSPGSTQSSSLEDVSSAPDSENDEESFGLKPMVAPSKAKRVRRKGKKLSHSPELADLRNENRKVSSSPRRPSRSRRKNSRRSLQR